MVVLVRLLGACPSHEETPESPADLGRTERASAVVSAAPAELGELRNWSGTLRAACLDIVDVST
jgi:hypothetical protein